MQKVPPKQNARAGTWVEMGDGKMYLIPPITLSKLEEYLPKLKTFRYNFEKPEANGLPESNDIGLMRDFVFACLSRNYPGLDKDEVYKSEMFDFAAVLQAFSAGVKISGLVPSEADKTMGEVAAVS